MSGRLIPWKRPRGEALARRETVQPFAELHRRMDDLFDAFLRDFDDPFRGPAAMPGFRDEAMLAPSVDVSETDGEVQVTADLPGLTEEDVEVTLDDNVLTIRGEKRQDREEKKRNWHVVERSYGRFQRSIPMPTGLEQDKVKANFKNGVLTVTLPKAPDAGSKKRTITIGTD